MNKEVILIGAGLGGLATGLRLASRGYKITFIEKNEKAGGRLNQIEKDGFTFDIGPSFFSMPYEFDELAEDCGIELPFEFRELEPLYTVSFSNSERKFYLYKDINKLSGQFTDLESDFERKFTKYLKKCEALFNDTVDIVIKRNFNSIPDYIKALLQVNPAHASVLYKTFWQQAGKYFKSKEVRQIVSLIAFFLGRTPFDTNGVYTLLSHVEFKHNGYYNVKGGMYNIVEGLVNELKKKNVTFHYNTEIVDFESNNSRLTCVMDNKGRKWPADTFVINADAAQFRSNVFKRKKFNDSKLCKMSWTMGYLTFYVGINVKLPQIEQHNYFLGNNYEEYSKGVMKKPDTLEKPYYYVNVLSKHNEDCAPHSHEALFFVCPVPNLLYKSDWNDKHTIIDSIIHDFSKRIKHDISKNIVLKMEYTPEDWQNKFNLYAGAGLGLSHKMLQIGAFRPKNYDEEFKNTFYVGGSTIPGAGLPMVIISSKLATERVLKHFEE